MKSKVMENMMPLHGCGWIIKEKRKAMIGVNIYKPLTWDEVLLFGCDEEKKEGRMSVRPARST